MPTLTHPRHGTFNVVADGDGLTQGQLEKFLSTYRELSKGQTRSASEENGLNVRTAINAGWLLNMSVDEVDKLSPRVVRWLSEQIDEIFKIATTPDPK